MCPPTGPGLGFSFFVWEVGVGGGRGRCGRSMPYPVFILHYATHPVPEICVRDIGQNGESEKALSVFLLSSKSSYFGLYCSRTDYRKLSYE